MNRLFEANNEYEQQVKEYRRIDALLAFTLYITIIILFILMGKLFVHKSSNLTETYIFCVTGIVSSVCIGLVFLFCFIRKQKLVTVGFSKKEAVRSLIVGITIIILAAVIWGIRPIISGATIITDVKLIIMRAIYFLFFIAFMEELVIRGYIGTRFYGCFNNKRLSIILVGVLFALLHIPFHMVVDHMSFTEYLSINRGDLFSYVIWHCVFQWLYSRYNSIIAPTFFHFIIDFIPWFII